MELVIKMPDEVNVSNIINEIDCLLTDYFNGTVCKITPLPKGHGRLKDIDKIINNGINKGFCNWYDEMKMADTIVEADKD